MGNSGEDVQLSEEAFKIFPYSVEAKCQESLSIWNAINQSEDQNRKGIPLLVFKRNHSDIYCCLKFKTFIDILQQNKVLKDNNEFLEQEVTPRTLGDDQ
jgi:hypothetical protein